MTWKWHNYRKRDCAAWAMRSAVALESIRVQASASLIMMSATISVPIDLHSAIKVAQHHLSSLWGDPWEMGLDGSWEREEHGLSEPQAPLSHPLFLSLIWFEGSGS